MLLSQTKRLHFPIGNITTGNHFGINIHQIFTTRMIYPIIIPKRDQAVFPLNGLERFLTDSEIFDNP